MRTFFAAALTAATILATGAQAATSVLFVLDASGSMWGRVDGEPKIEIARRVLSGLVRDLPSDVEVGLAAYGHNRKDDCADIEMLAPLGTERGSLIEAVMALNPKGMTPLTDAIKLAASQLQSVESAASVVVISDGKETCEGDPCAAAAAARASGANVRIHVVGFDVSGEEAEQLNCIAEKGGGKYFSASNASELASAFAEVKVVVAQAEPAPAPPPPPPPPPPAEPSVYFFDDFDGEDLDPHWELANPNPDGYIVEGGKLLLVNGGDKWFGTDAPENMLHLNKAMPKGNWQATLKYDITYQTGLESLFFGLYADKNNLIGARHHVYTYSCCTLQFEVIGIKIANGEATEFRANAYSYRTESGGIKIQGEKIPQPQYLRVTKRGRNYVVSAKFGDDPQTQWVEIQKLTLLRPKGKLSLQFANHQATPGEALIEIDSVKVESLP